MKQYKITYLNQDEKVCEESIFANGMVNAICMIENMRDIGEMIKVEIELKEPQNNQIKK